MKRSGWLLVMGLGFFSVAIIAGLFYMKRSAGTHGNSQLTAVTAAAKLQLGPAGSASLLPYNLTPDTFPLYIATLPAQAMHAFKLDSVVKLRKLALIQWVKRAPLTLLVVDEAGIKEGDGKILLAAPVGTTGYLVSFTHLQAGPMGLALQLLDAKGLPASDEVFVAWDAVQQRFTLR